MKEWKLAGNKL